MHILVYLRKKKGAGGRGEATAGESVLETPLSGTFYADDPGVMSQSPEQLRKMMGMIVVMCATFGLAVSEGKTEIMVDGVFPGEPQDFRHQRRTVDDCSPGREGMAQNGGTRGETLHCEMDRCRESQGWTTACSRVLERDGKD